MRKYEPKKLTPIELVDRDNDLTKVSPLEGQIVGFVRGESESIRES